MFESTEFIADCCRLRCSYGVHCYRNCYHCPYSGPDKSRPERCKPDLLLSLGWCRRRNQLHRLFSTTIRWTYTDEARGYASGRGLVVAGEHQLTWSPRDPAQKPSWSSRVALGREFFDEITSSSVPVDLRAIRLLERSPLALDIYVWLTYRMSYLKRPCLIPWEALRDQFGAEYARLTDFRRRFLKALRLVLRVYSRARVRQSVQGLWLLPSPSHVQGLKGADHERAPECMSIDSDPLRGGRLSNPLGV